jgi:hypothetical protein
MKVIPERVISAFLFTAIKTTERKKRVIDYCLTPIFQLYHVENK